MVLNICGWLRSTAPHHPSSSRAFTNAKGTIANVNYGRIVGSYDNMDIAYNTQQINLIPSKTINLPITNNQPCKNIYSDGICIKN